jgi:hypothetical protein
MSRTVRSRIRGMFEVISSVDTVHKGTGVMLQLYKDLKNVDEICSGILIQSTRYSKRH